MAKIFNPSKFRQTQSSVESPEHAVVADGYHIAVVEHVSTHKSASTGSPSLVFAFKIIGPNDPDIGTVLGRQFYALTERAMWKLVALCDAIDPPEDGVEKWAFDLTSIDSIERAFLQQCPLVIKTVTKNAKIKSTFRKRCEVVRHRALNQADYEHLLSEYGESLRPYETDDRDDDTRAIGVPTGGSVAGVGDDEEHVAEFDDGLDASL